MRKELEKCDIVTDLNCFIRMKSTGTKPPGELEYFILERSLNTLNESEVDRDTNPQNLFCSQHAFEKQQLISVLQ